MDFSVLMSVYYKDNPQWLKEAIDSVLNNTIKPNQIVLVVDGQIPNELEQVITEYTDSLDILRLEKNSGLGIALKQGLLKCKYPLVARMDSDDISLPMRFELQLKEFEKNPNLTIVGSYMQEIDSHTKENISVRKVPLTNEDIRRYIKKRNPFNHSAVMFKKNDILGVGNYSSTMKFAQDYLLWMRLVNANSQMKNIPEILVNFRVDKNMFARRSGYKYFKLKKTVYDELLRYKIINYFEYLFNLFVCFFVHVIMPNNMRELFYKKVLR